MTSRIAFTESLRLIPIYCIGIFSLLIFASTLLPILLNTHSANTGYGKGVYTRAHAPRHAGYSAPGLTVIGEIHPKNKYAIFGCTLQTTGNVYQYAFPLPLTALAWNRIGYKSIVVLVGRKDVWTGKPQAKLIVDKLLELDACVVFMEASETSQTMISQVSRIFTPVILANVMNISMDTYVITTDSDLWPITSTLYTLPSNKDILSTNSNCCRAFAHKGKKYKMLPMANIGMKVSSWVKLIMAGRKNITIPVDSMTIKEYLRAEFGNIVDKKVKKGGNLGWYLDQRLVSILIQSRASLLNLTVEYRPRKVRKDRIDRSRWKPNNLTGKKDAHIIHLIFRKENWNRILPLIKLMFPGKLDWCMAYYADFLKLG